MYGFPKLGPREIGERVSAIFADERRQINEVVRAAMMEVKDRESEPDNLVAAQLLPTLRARAGFETSDVMTTGNRTGPTTVPLPRVSTARRSRSRVRRRRRATPARGQGCSRFWRSPGSRPCCSYFPGSVRSQRSGAAEPSAPPAAEKAAPKAQVGVKLRAFPDAAELLLDGRPLGANPYVAELAQDDRVHELEVRARGFSHAEAATPSRTRPRSGGSPQRRREDVGHAHAAVVSAAERRREELCRASVAGAGHESRRTRRHGRPRAARSKKDAGELYGEFPKSKPPGRQSPAARHDEPLGAVTSASRLRRRAARGESHERNARGGTRIGVGSRHRSPMLMQRRSTSCWIAISRSRAACARPQAADPEVEARERYERALKLYEERAFDAALVELKLAAELRPSYKLLYNIAQVRLAMNDFAAANGVVPGVPRARWR